MTPEQMGNLACLVVDDPSALPVLQDALLEAGWTVSIVAAPDDRGRWHIDVNIRRPHGWYYSEIVTDAHPGPAPRVTSETPPEWIAPALAAVLLSNAWDPGMWPVVARCRCEEPCERTGRGCRWVNEDVDEENWTTYCADCFRERTYEIGEFPG